MLHQPTAQQVRDCEKAFKQVRRDGDLVHPIPAGQPVTVMVAQDGQEGFLYNVNKRDLGMRITAVTKWIAQPKLERLLNTGSWRQRRGAVSVAEAIKDLDFATIGPGYRRGLVMAEWKAKVCQVTGRKDWHDDLDRAWLTGQRAAAGSEAYRHPTLYIRMQPGSLWIPELDMQRYRICWKLNDRFDKEFLNEVRIT